MYDIFVLWFDQMTQRQGFKASIKMGPGKANCNKPTIKSKRRQNAIRADENTDEVCECM